MGRLGARLGRELDCEVSCDGAVRDYYSADASMYRLRPRAVAFPEREEDVIRAVKFARRHGMALTPRGAGTGLVGGALGGQLVLDLKRMDRMRICGDSAVLEPGVIKGRLDEELARRGKFLSPDPSVGRYCSIGGMVGTNAGGIHALKYGCVIDNMLGVTLIDGRGGRIRLPEDAGTGRRILEIAQRADTAGFPKTSKNSCGYRLDRVMGMSDTHRVLAGAEGTLGIMTRVRMRIRDIPEKRALAVLSYVDTCDVHHDVNRIAGTDPAAVEYLDGYTVGNIGRAFRRGAVAALFVEYDGRDAGRQMARLRRTARGRTEFSTTSVREMQRWWGYRNSALAYSFRAGGGGGGGGGGAEGGGGGGGAGGGGGGGGPAPHIIEDAAVPVGSLKKMFGLIGSVNERYGTKAVVYGHAGDGNLHVRMVAGGLSKGMLEGSARMFFEGVIGMGGTITAEHGDGIARSWFVRMQYGEKNHRLFRELKKTLDPDGVMNPGKVVTAAGAGMMTKHLEYRR